MGAMCSGLSAEEAEANKKSKEVDAQNEAAFKKEQEKIKLLLLGAGESGKSTIFKQMKMLYGAGNTLEDKKMMTPVVYSNTIAAMRILLDQAKNFGYDQEIVNQEAIEIVSTAPETNIDLKIGAAIKSLWEDQGLIKTWNRRSEFQIVESVKYYFNKIDQIMQPGYMASDDDILYARVRTSGIVTERYVIDGTIFEMYDVGGQRNERKKWIHCFDNVTAIIFVAALSEYDQVLFEDASTNRMIEAINLFKEICNNRFFINSSMLLFLNKRDLFGEKIWVKDIKDVPQFSDYKGALGDFESGVEYFLNLFLSVNESPDKMIYHHVTCATDTKNVEVVFNACKDIILRGNLKDSGFMD